jgi:hypothetical protein
MFRALFGKGTGARAAVPAAATPLIPGPIRLTNALLAFHAGVTTRREIEHSLGPAIAYPAPGWQTWSLAGMRDAWILSAFYKDSRLLGVEYYIAKTGELPRYVPRIKGAFRFVPGDIGLGNSLATLPEGFAAAGGLAGTVRAVVYQQIFQARWTAGMAIVAGNDGLIERLALYANLG